MKQSDSSFLEKYFQRIGYTGLATPTLECLRILHRLHEESIPFENLNVLLGHVIRIDSDSVFEKLVEQRRGGYCFEQNTLFSDVLRKIGFRVTPYIARVRWQAPVGTTTPLTHMILGVETEKGPYLADVGFGGPGLIEPISLQSEATQHLDFEPRRVVDTDGGHLHQMMVGEEWRDVYLFEAKGVAPVDLEIGNWYSCTHPKARFRNSLLVAQISSNGRIMISDTELITRDWNGHSVRTAIEGKAQLKELLKTRFDLELDHFDQLPFPTPLA
ncbi:arylamine N-acetyltransferase family protein [Pelagicoccus albus]|uniref:Arylamine N-acetyltransferase n=1 Tax=Pelagicoccus albus TaxID=415222 RepID=A0A7X1B3F8_9BACT|nr:arylamine N-acetyltransferase [Pelagicoccus albus]MBC2604931.1 arylamine N-acetyltransferase [Pelagicoccus albus]